MKNVDCLIWFSFLFIALSIRFGVVIAVKRDRRINERLESKIYRSFGRSAALLVLSVGRL